MTVAYHVFSLGGAQNLLKKNTQLKTFVLNYTKTLF